jgi:hypothetical protein
MRKLLLTAGLAGVVVILAYQVPQPASASETRGSHAITALATCTTCDCCDNTCQSNFNHCVVRCNGVGRSACIATCNNNYDACVARCPCS